MFLSDIRQQIRVLTAKTSAVEPGAIWCARSIIVTGVGGTCIKRDVTVNTTETYKLQNWNTVQLSTGKRITKMGYCGRIHNLSLEVECGPP